MGGRKTLRCTVEVRDILIRAGQNAWMEREKLRRTQRLVSTEKM